MDKLTLYGEIIEKTLTEIGDMLRRSDDCEALLCFDRLRGQYLLMSDGWSGGDRYYHPVAHLEVRPDGEVWLRADNTDLEIGKDLIKQGIDKNDMVPAFYSPHMRELIKNA